MRRNWVVVVVVLALGACSSGSKKSAGGPTSSSNSLSTTSSMIASPAVQLRNLDHIVVMMQENRSFDSYFSSLDPTGQSPYDNPDPTNPAGPRIATFANPNMCETADLAHGWNAVHDEIDGGKMDGFTKANIDPTDKTGKRAMARYGPTDLPFYYALANAFGIGTRYFASVPGPTYPNRYYLVAGTSFGHINNAFPSGKGWTQKTVFEELDKARVTWKIYDSGLSVESLLFAYVRTHSGGHVERISQYFADAAAGTLPQVAFVEPTFVGRVKVENDEHPPANPQRGQELASRVVNALMKSPNWSSSAFFETWDEHGGYADHVAPPAAPKPDAIAPILAPGDPASAFDLYGVRVPVLVVSPWSRPHYVSDVVHDHTSILRTIELRFGLPALTRRDALASPMTEFFDFSHPSYATPPQLPPATIDAAQEAKCVALYKDKILGI